MPIDDMEGAGPSGRPGTSLRPVWFAAFFCVVLALVWCRRETQAEAAPPPNVVVAQPIQRVIDHYLDTTGVAAAVNTVDLTARVQGFLQEQSYTDGQAVTRGATLFTIEPEPYLAQLQQAQAEQQAAEAHLVYTTAQYNRQAVLARDKVSAQATLDQAQADRDGDRATVAQKQAAARAAAINYAYTRITAPFDGIVTAHLVAVGNVVNVNTKLASVVQLDPIYVNFTVSEQDAERIRARLAQRGVSIAGLGTIPVEAGLQTESGTPHAGHLDYANPGIDTGTGTLAVRAVFENKDHVLLPGNFVRIRLAQERGVRALLVPDAALGTDQGGDTLLVVDTDNVVRRKRVVRGERLGDLREIASGLTATDRVIVGGMQHAVPGQTVQPDAAP